MWRYGQYCQADWISTYAFAWHCYADEVRAGEILVMGWFLYCICMLCLDCLHLYVSLPLERYKLYCAEQKSDLDDCSDAQRVLNKEELLLERYPNVSWSLLRRGKSSQQVLSIINNTCIYYTLGENLIINHLHYIYFLFVNTSCFFIYFYLLLFILL